MRATRDQTDANRRYYWDHRSEEIARVRRRQTTTAGFLASLKSGPCSDCRGLFAAHQMDFDHRDPSTKSFWLSGDPRYWRDGSAFSPRWQSATWSARTAI